MTPFGKRLRELRARKGVTQKQMAAELGLSAAYLSGLEHGRRGRPSSGLVRQACAYFGLFWDDAEALRRLAEVSHPRIKVDTSGLSPRATELANLIAASIETLDEDTIAWIVAEIRGRIGARGPREP
ncbi:MAG: helix-turn-helix transcriptional regulator [Rhodospirillales bacterium]|nr:helix-turn-helix transcriptional regulator [Rhodospirillales bacterium]